MQELDDCVRNEEAAAIVKYYAEKSNQDIALHYDHGFTIELVKKAIDVGFTSVMIDGSSLPFEENVAKTKEIVAYAHERNVTVEAEIGHVFVMVGVNTYSPPCFLPKFHHFEEFKCSFKERALYCVNTATF